MSKWHATVGSAPLCEKVLPSQLAGTVSGEPAHAYDESASRTWYGGRLGSPPVGPFCPSAPGTPTMMVLTLAVSASCAPLTSATMASGCSQSLQPLPSV